MRESDAARLSTNNPLANHTPELIGEAVSLPGLHADSEECFIRGTYLSVPKEDNDRNGWMKMLGLAARGHLLQTGISQNDLARDIQDQLRGVGYKDWMTAWNTIRWIPGQADRMATELNEYKMLHEKGEPYPWRAAIIGYIIMLVRLDHPEYKQEK